MIRAQHEDRPMQFPLVFSLKRRAILALLLLMNLLFLFTGYVSTSMIEQAVLEEKGAKLLAVTHILNRHLGPGGFAAILKRYEAENLSRDEKVAVLNEALRDITDEVAAISPGIGVGYYARDLDAIVSYGPSDEYGFTVGMPIPETHPGRIVMRENVEKVDSGTMVRGDILNAMSPIRRDGAVIGYIWSNELTTEITLHFDRVSRNLLITIVGSFILTFILIMLISRRTLGDVERIVEGVRAMRFDLSRRIQPAGGELGEVVDNINSMAKALSNARSLSDVVITSMDNGLVAVDREGCFSIINPSAERTIGITAEQHLGRHFREVFGPGPLSDTFEETLENENLSVLHEAKCRLKNRDTYLVLTSSLLRGLHGEKVGVLLTFRDITERVSLQEQVRTADRLSILGELMAGVAHEIRNPLTCIKGMLQYFQGMDDPAAQKTHLPLVLREVDRMDTIIENLLFFARPNEALPDRVRIGDVLRESMLLIGHQAAKNSVTFEADIPDDLPCTLIDKEQFKQVFLNLFLNSIQAMDGPGVIRVSARVCSDTENIVVSFSDTGPGIAPDIRSLVLTPFYTSKPNGTGLGLSVTQRIVLSAGGRIEIDETPEGGALVRIFLPLADEGGTV
jgi:two-component system sensor histidine kinase AtoS